MASPAPPQYPPQVGTLILDNGARTASLRHFDADGNSVDSLMLINTLPPGTPRSVQIRDAYLFFSGRPNGHNTVVYGFYIGIPGTAETLLYVYPA